jgi:hypothetical protein
VWLAALNQLEELAAKKITSGPDRRLEPVEEASPHEGSIEVATLGPEAPDLVSTLTRVESGEEQSKFLRLKASEILTYLQSGAAE